MIKEGQFLDQIRTTKKLAALTVFFVTITGVYFEIASEKTHFLFVTKEYILWGYTGSFILVVLTFVLETIWYLIRDKLSIFRDVVGELLNFIATVVKFVFYWGYILPLRLLLRPILVELLGEYKDKEGENGERFVFINQKIGVRSDDHYFYRSLDVRKLSIKAKPVRMYPRWRLGLKFSPDGVFPSARFDKNHILFHLTKDQGRDSLDYHLYKNGVLESSEVLIQNYQGQMAYIEVTTDDSGTKINIQDSSEQTIKQIEIPKQVSAQLFAWADGVSNFEIETYVHEE